MSDYPQETMIDTYVTYTVELDGKFYIIENVPARVCKETGEEFYAPETVEKIQKMIVGDEKPSRYIQTPVFEFS